MALRKEDLIVDLSSSRVQPLAQDLTLDNHSAVPQPLLELYERASLFLDKQSAVHDHYWAVGIHKAVHQAFPRFATEALGNRLPISHSKAKRRRKAPSEQLRLSLPEDHLTASGSGQEIESGFSRFYTLGKNVPVGVGQHVVLISEMWSTRNRMAIEAGTRGRVVGIGSKIKVRWKLPYYRKRLSDLFAPDEYLDYFEEE
jgi:hypothetical protein